MSKIAVASISRTLGIAVGSTCSKPGDVDGNIAQIAMLADKSSRAGCNVLLTPEMSASGYGNYNEVLATAEIAGQGPIYTELANIARINDITLMAGFVEKSGIKKHIAHYIINPDGSYIVQCKHRVTSAEFPLDPSVDLYYDESEEIGHVPDGMVNINYFHIGKVKCALLICADVGIRGLHDILDKANVELLFVPVGAGGSKDNKVTNEELRTPEGLEKYIILSDNEYFYPRGNVRSCIEHHRAIAVVNMCGWDDKRMYHGGSGSIIDCFGVIAGHLPGIENIDRQKPTIAFGEICFDDKL